MLSILVAAIVAALAGLALRRQWWRTAVRSWSMYPALQPGTHRWTRRLRATAPVRRGDIVVIDSAELGRRVVKRVIGLPGETVDVTSGAVLVDGRPLPEPYVRSSGGPTGSYRLPADSYFVLGDNRPLSSDSRAWATPYVPRAAITGRLLVANVES